MDNKVVVRSLAAAILAFFLIGYTSESVSAKTINWRMVSVWHASLVLSEIDKKFVKMVNEMSGERLKIKLFSAGEAIPAFEVFDAVKAGAMPIGGESPVYWGGKDPVFALAGTSTMLLSWVDQWVWLFQGGGIELLQEIYAKNNLVWFPLNMVPAESGFRTNKPINSLKDFKGMKLRISGKLQGELLRRLGASPVMLSGAEVYQALEKGTIDGTEFAVPSIDWPMGLGEVTKYWLTPCGWHQTAGIIGVLINKKEWDKLPNDLKKIIEYAAMADVTWSTSMMEYGSFDATHKFIEKGIKVTRLPDEDLEKIQKIYNEIIIEEAKKHASVAKVLKSQVQFLKDAAKWRDMVTPFGYGRNAVLPDLSGIK